MTEHRIDRTTAVTARPRTRLAGALASMLLVVSLAACSGTSSGNDLGSGPSTGPTAPSTDGAPTSTSTSTTTSTTTTTTLPPSTTSTTTTTTVPPTELPEPPGPLQSGSVGTRTKALQQALIDQHYDPGEPDGRFGIKTMMAIWAFQALHGLPADGVVSPDLEAVLLARPGQEMLRPDLGPTHTEVDLTRQVLIVWRDGAPALITHISSGSQVAYCENTKVGRHCGAAVTPEGLFHYERRIEGWREAALGRLYNPVYFRGGFAVHGAGSVPNHPASHGCVRTPMHIAEYFPGLVAKGDAIVIFRS